MGITKQAENKQTFRRHWIKTESARDAWFQIIEEYKSRKLQGRILLPAYIGYSVNEGSGIFDSVRKSGLAYNFYSLNKNLEIDLDDFKQKVLRDPEQLVLLVHYFGFTDTKYLELTSWLEGIKVEFIEDCAHSWIGDLVGGVCGRKGRKAFYSLHKLLPIKSGGILVDNSGQKELNDNPSLNLGYDLYSIYELRRRNFYFLRDRLENVKGISLMKQNLEPGICPQTLPILIEGQNRNEIYSLMNEQGFGLVSLYHTMISELDNYNCPSNKYTALHITNLPIHQDANLEDLEKMCQKLEELIND